MLQSEAGYIDARPHIRQIDEIFLQRTAGPYIRVRLGPARAAATGKRHLYKLPSRSVMLARVSPERTAAKPPATSDAVFPTAISTKYSTESRYYGASATSLLFLCSLNIPRQTENVQKLTCRTVSTSRFVPEETNGRDTHSHDASFQAG
jgi:hypothetical protein